MSIVNKNRRGVSALATATNREQCAIPEETPQKPGPRPWPGFAFRCEDVATPFRKRLPKEPWAAPLAWASLLDVRPWLRAFRKRHLSTLPRASPVDSIDVYQQRFIL
jgi:hypothetical protein